MATPISWAKRNARLAIALRIKDRERLFELARAAAKFPGKPVSVSRLRRCATQASGEPGLRLDFAQHDFGDFPRGANSPRTKLLDPQAVIDRKSARTDPRSRR